jgi:hypothetical protein
MFKALLRPFKGLLKVFLKGFQILVKGFTTACGKEVILGEDQGISRRRRRVWRLDTFRTLL